MAVYVQRGRLRGGEGMSAIGKLRYFRASVAFAHARKNLVKCDRIVRQQFKEFGAATDFDKQQFTLSKNVCAAKFRVLYPDQENPYESYKPNFDTYFL